MILAVAPHLTPTPIPAEPIPPLLFEAYGEAQVAMSAMGGTAVIDSILKECYEDAITEYINTPNYLWERVKRDI